MRIHWKDALPRFPPGLDVFLQDNHDHACLKVTKPFSVLLMVLLDYQLTLRDVGELNFTSAKVGSLMEYHAETITAAM